MRCVFFGRGQRGTSCLAAFHKEKIAIDCVVAEAKDSFFEQSQKFGYETIVVDDPNSPEARALLKARKPDLFILAGYSKILQSDTIAIPTRNAVNLHGGALPKYRGSSPLNWALINGEKSFSLSVISVSPGVDAGDVLLDKSFRLRDDSTIKELHDIANEQFPRMLLQVYKGIKSRKIKAKKQNKAKASYYPLRFPQDGFIVWDALTAEEVANRVRALTDPYPCAFTFWNKQKIQLLATEPTNTDFFGEPGRIYRKTEKGLLVCAKDKSLWITKYRPVNSSFNTDSIRRYDSFATLKGMLLAGLEEK